MPTATRERKGREAPDLPPPPGEFVPVSIKVDGVDPDHLMLAGVDTRANPFYPLFSIGEAAKLFFGLTDHSMRLWERHGLLGEVKQDPGGHARVFAPDGTEIGQRRNQARTYSLGDIERIIHSLAGHRAITGEQAAYALVMVKARAEIARSRTEHAARNSEVPDLDPLAVIPVRRNGRARHGVVVAEPVG